jgi:hypothetical protein
VLHEDQYRGRNSIQNEGAYRKIRPIRTHSSSAGKNVESRLKVMGRAYASEARRATFGRVNDHGLILGVVM